MRFLDKLTEEEERKLERAEQSHDTAREEQEEAAEAYDQAPETVRRYRSVIAVVKAMLARRQVDLTRMTELSEDERAALSELRQAIEGRRNGNFYFAEDRLEALNEVLAVLQPILSVAMLPEAYDLRRSFDRIRDQINELRGQLTMLEAAEDEDLRAKDETKKGEADDDDDDDEGDDADGADEGEGEGDDAAGETKTKKKQQQDDEDDDAPEAPAPDEPTP